jgi:hypothetical protein
VLLDLIAQMGDASVFMRRASFGFVEFLLGVG